MAKHRPKERKKKEFMEKKLKAERARPDTVMQLAASV